MTTVATGKAKRFSRKKKIYPLVNGKPIRLRGFQQLIWLAVSIALGAGFFAGLYWLGLQQNWHNIFPFLPRTASAKAWWDGGMGFIRNKNWTNGIYRHGVRDNAEPTLWIMVGATLLGKASRRRYVLPGWVLIIAPLLLFALIIAGSLLITWFHNFGPGKHLPDPFSLQTIILAAALGRLLHFAWAPIGNSVRYHVVTRSLRKNTTPLWVSLPLLPPTWREMWADLKAQGKVLADARAEKKQGRDFHQSRIIIPLMLFAFLVIAIVGDLAKWAFAHGVHVPFLNP